MNNKIILKSCLRAFYDSLHAVTSLVCSVQLSLVSAPSDGSNISLIAVGCSAGEYFGEQQIFFKTGIYK